MTTLVMNPKEFQASLKFAKTAKSLLSISNISQVEITSKEGIFGVIEQTHKSKNEDCTVRDGRASKGLKPGCLYRAVTVQLIGTHTSAFQVKLSEELLKAQVNLLLAPYKSPFGSAYRLCKGFIIKDNKYTAEKGLPNGRCYVTVDLYFDRSDRDCISTLFRNYVTSECSKLQNIA